MDAKIKLILIYLNDESILFKYQLQINLSQN